MVLKKIDSTVFCDGSIAIISCHWYNHTIINPIYTIEGNRLLMVGLAELGAEGYDMKRIEHNLRLLPIVGYLGFFLLYIVLGLLLISGGLLPDPSFVTDPPLYQPLTYVDLLILLAMNIPTIFVLAVAVKRSNSVREDTTTDRMIT